MRKKLFFLAVIFISLASFISCKNNNTKTKKNECTEHVFIEQVISEPTCTQKGLIKYTCEKCGYYYTKSTNATNHNIVSEIHKEPNCVEDGILRYKCTKCNYYHDEKLPALGHTLGDLIITKKAKCESNGEGYRKCSVCGKNIVESIPKLHHKLDETKHCTNEGCNYFELFDCQIIVKSQFETTTYNLKLEYGQSFSIEPKIYDVHKLLFDVYYDSEAKTKKVSNEDGVFLNTYSGQSTISVFANYYYSVATPNDLMELETNQFIINYFKKNNITPLQVVLEYDINFQNINWKPMIVKGPIIFDGLNHIIKNYYSDTGGIFKEIGTNSNSNQTTIKNIVFENASLNISNIATNDSNELYYSVGILANIMYGKIDNIIIKSGNITVNQNGDIDLGVAGICGSVRYANNCLNYATINTNTPIASGITTSAINIINCQNYGEINAGDYIISPLLMNSFDKCYGAAGICTITTKVSKCVNYGNVHSKILHSAGITIYSEEIEECSNKGNIISDDYCSAGIVVAPGNGLTSIGKISKCSNYGDITGKTKVGGIASLGYVISYCYNVGEITSTEYAGGLVGILQAFDSVKYCYNTRSISGQNNCYGGIAGKGSSLYSENLILVKCINNSSNFIPNGCSLTQCEILDESTDVFISVGYDSSIWLLSENNLPILLWECDYN